MERRRHVVEFVVEACLKSHKDFNALNPECFDLLFWYMEGKEVDSLTCAANGFTLTRSLDESSLVVHSAQDFGSDGNVVGSLTDEESVHEARIEVVDSAQGSDSDSDEDGSLIDEESVREVRIEVVDSAQGSDSDSDEDGSLIDEGSVRKARIEVVESAQRSDSNSDEVGPLIGEERVHEARIEVVDSAQGMDSDVDEVGSLTDEESVNERLRVSRYFSQIREWHDGWVTSCSTDRFDGTKWYRVLYEDGDGEHVNEEKFQKARAMFDQRHPPDGLLQEEDIGDDDGAIDNVVDDHNDYDDDDYDDGDYDDDDYNDDDNGDEIYWPPYLLPH